MEKLIDTLSKQEDDVYKYFARVLKDIEKKEQELNERRKENNGQ